MRNELTVNQNLELESFSEIELRKLSGFILLKPDAVYLDIVEYIINYIATRCKLNIGIVKIVSFIAPESIEAIYPDLSEAFREATINYMVSGECVLISYHRNACNIDLWEELKQLKGSSMWNWRVEGYDFERQLGITPFIRGLIPIPGTEDDYRPVIEKVRTRQRFTEKELALYVQNLVHSPINIEEYTSLYELLNTEEKSYFLERLDENRRNS